MNINFENVKAAYYRGQNILKIYSGSTMEWEYETEPMEQTTKQIWYNSNSGEIVEPYNASAMGTLVSNTAYESKCVLEYASDITAIGANAFSGCTDLEYVSIPVSATSIGDNAFDGCSALDDIYMPSVQRIGRESFKDCAFSSFTISSAVTAITADAFKGVAMESFDYDGTKAQWSAITTGDFWDDDTWITNVVHCSDGDIELYQYDYSKRYLELVATSGGTFQFSGKSDDNISYSTDQGKTWSTPSSSITINVNSGDSVMFKGQLSSNNNQEIKRFNGSTASFDAQGNIMSLLYGDNFKNQTSLSGTNKVFCHLFDGTKVANAENLSLPATTLANTCYYAMFWGCTSLTTAPELPATTLAASCYYYMFKGCTSLTTAPQLPATTLASRCYEYMFWGCSHLNYIKMLATDISAYECLNFWVYSVANSGTFIKDPSMTSLPTGNSGIPSGWVAYDDGYGIEYLTLKARESGTLTFSGSSTANTISYSTDQGKTWSTPAQVVSVNVNSDDSVMWKGEMVSEWGNGIGNFSGGTATFDAQGNIMSLLYGDNFRGQTSLSGKNYAFGHLFELAMIVNAENLILPTTTLIRSCYESMFKGCTSLRQAPELPATTLEIYCYFNMFSGCTSLTQAPELPATTLVDRCYQNMFRGCTNLNHIKMLATDISAMMCIDNWVRDVAATGTFVKNVNATLPTGTSGIPNGWTVQDDGASPAHDYSQDYFTIVAKEDGDIMVYGCDYVDENEGAVGWCEIEYSTDNGETWAVAPYEEDDGPSRITFNVQSGDTIMLKYDARTLYDNPDISLNNEGVICLFNNGDGSAEYEVQGNIMSLIYGDDFTGNTSLDYNGREIKFGYMFNGNGMLVSAENLVLPSETLDKCYDGMFSDCISLTKAPQLPATTLVGSCYYGMFRNCTSLETAPELPAAILTDNGDEGCYQEMFQSCSNLNYIKMLATDISASNCLTDWVWDVAASGTFVKNQSMTSLPTGDNGIPTGWSVQNA